MATPGEDTFEMTKAKELVQGIITGVDDLHVQAQRADEHVARGEIYGRRVFGISADHNMPDTNTIIYTHPGGLQVYASVTYDGRVLTVTPRLLSNDGIVASYKEYTLYTSITVYRHRVETGSIEWIINGAPLVPWSRPLHPRYLVRTGEDDPIRISCFATIADTVCGRTNFGMNASSTLPLSSARIHTSIGGRQVWVVATYDGSKLTVTPHCCVDNRDLAKHKTLTLRTTITVDKYDPAGTQFAQYKIRGLSSRGGDLNPKSWVLPQEDLVRTGEKTPIKICFVASVESTRVHGRRKIIISRRTEWPFTIDIMYPYPGGPEARLEVTYDQSHLVVTPNLVNGDSIKVSYRGRTLHTVISVNIPGEIFNKSAACAINDLISGVGNLAPLSWALDPDFLDEEGEDDHVTISGDIWVSQAED